MKKSIIFLLVLSIFACAFVIYSNNLIHFCAKSDCNKFYIGLPFQYCKTHTCHYNGCSGKLLNDEAEGCELHICKIVDCYKLKNKDSKYCSEHKCSLSNCNALRSNDESVYFWDDYCDEHSGKYCSKTQCNEPVYKSTKMCREHLLEKAKNTIKNDVYDSITTPGTNQKKYNFSNKKSYDDYSAKDYATAEDFYDEWYDDFTDFDEAEEYWDDYN